MTWKGFLHRRSIAMRSFYVFFVVGQTSFWTVKFAVIWNAITPHVTSLLRNYLPNFRVHVKLALYATDEDTRETDRIVLNHSLCNTLAPQQPPRHKSICFALQRFSIHEVLQKINQWEDINLHGYIYNITQMFSKRGVIRMRRAKFKFKNDW